MRVIFTVLWLSAATLMARTPMQLLDDLRDIKSEEVSTSQSGWINSSRISDKDEPTTVIAGTVLKAKLLASLTNAKEIYLSAYFLGDAEIIKGICTAKRINNALAVALLDNKVNAQKYITPDFLTQSGVFLFYPPKQKKLSGGIVIIDRKEVFLMPEFDFTKEITGVYLNSQQAAWEAMSLYLKALNDAEMSDYTKLRNPNAMRIINETLKKE